MFDDVSIVILAAGQGTRMKSRLAKVLHKVGGRTLIHHAIAAARAIAPAERIFVVVGHQAEAVAAEARGQGVNSFVQETQSGTGHAVMCGEEHLKPLGGLLMVINGDCPMIQAETLMSLVRLYRETGSAAAMVTTDLDDATGYGRILRKSDGDVEAGDVEAGDVEAIVEHKAATPAQLSIHEINAGFYCFSADAFWRYVHGIGTDNPAGEYYLTDMIAILIGAGLRVTALKVADSSELLGINNKVELAAADRLMRDRTVRQLMLQGVTIEKPETVTIDAGIAVGMDTVIEPFARLTGTTVVGENCHIGSCSIIEDSQLGDHVEVFPFSMVSFSRLDKRAHAGPFARLRMGAHLNEDSHVGNFVELKKTNLGAGSKSMHLAYLGDSTIGARVNIGAGTITCNYDGEKKHPTTIGDGAFVGSNSTLVAPLEIAGGAYIAAGSVITEAVPAQALALGRARQVIKEGWTRSRNKAQKG